MENGRIDAFSEMLLIPYGNNISNGITKNTHIEKSDNKSFKEELNLNLDKEKPIKRDNTKLEKPCQKEKTHLKEQEKKRDTNNIREEKIKEKTGDKTVGKNDDAVDKTDNKKYKSIDKKQTVKNSLKNRIEELKKNIKKNTEVKVRIKKNVETKFNASQRADTNKNIEKLFLKQTENRIKEKVKDYRKNNKISSDDIGKRFKNVKQKNNVKLEKNEQSINKQEKAPHEKQKTTVIKKISGKENHHGTSLNLDLNREINSSVIKLDKTSNIKQLFEQYKEISDKILNKVGNVIKYLATDGGKSITIKLQPPELGRIQVELIMKDHIIDAKINTENIAVKEVILTNLDQLKANIENNGFNINKLDIEVGGFKNFLFKESNNFSNDKRRKSNDFSGRGTSNSNNLTLISEKHNNPYNFFIGRSVNLLA